MVKKYFSWFLVGAIVVALFWARWGVFEGRGGEDFYRVTFLGLASFIMFVMVALYTFRKRLVLSLAGRWKLSDLQKMEMKEAAKHLKELKNKINQGLLSKAREIEKVGQNMISPLTISRFFRIKVKLGWDGEPDPNLVRREPWGRLFHWYNAHLYLGALAFFAALIHSDFHGGRTVVTSSLFWLLWLVTITGIAGGLIHAFVPAILTRLEANVTLEQMLYLRGQLQEKLGEQLLNRSPEFVRAFKSIQNKNLNHDLVQHVVRRVPDDEQEPFLQTIVTQSQLNRLTKRHSQIRFIYFILRRWMVLHIPLAVSFMVLSCLHAGAILYY